MSLEINKCKNFYLMPIIFYGTDEKAGANRNMVLQMDSEKFDS